MTIKSNRVLCFVKVNFKKQHKFAVVKVNMEFADVWLKFLKVFLKGLQKLRLTYWYI